MCSAQSKLTSRFFVYVLIIFVMPLRISSASGDESPLEVFRKAHARDVEYEVRGGLMIRASMLSAFPPEAVEMMNGLRGARREAGPDGQDFVVNSAMRWIGNHNGDLRVESRVIYNGGSADRSTTASIWTAKSHAEGLLSSRHPTTAYTFEPLSLNEEWEYWSIGRTPFARDRASTGGYIELVRYALRVLAGAGDVIFGIDSTTGHLWGRSDSWQVYIEGGAQSGEVFVIVMGFTSKIAERHEYQGRLSKPLFPALHPSRELAYHYDFSNQTDWWKPGDQERPVNGYFSYFSAEEVATSPSQFVWHDPEWNQDSIPDSVILQTDSDGKPLVEPVFVPSKQNPNRLVPNTPVSKSKVLLVAAGGTLILSGGVLVLRRRFG